MLPGWHFSSHSPWHPPRFPLPAPPAPHDILLPFVWCFALIKNSSGVTERGQRRRLKRDSWGRIAGCLAVSLHWHLLCMYDMYAPATNIRNIIMLSALRKCTSKLSPACATHFYDARTTRQNAYFNPSVCGKVIKYTHFATSSTRERESMRGTAAAAAAASKSCLELCAMFPCYPSIVCAPFRHIKTSTELNWTEQNSTQTDSTWLHFSFISCGIPHQRRVVRFYECIIKLERTNLRERAKNVFQILFLYAYVSTHTSILYYTIYGWVFLAAP